MHPPLSAGKRYPLFRSLALTLAGFLLILFGLNLYQYFKIKTDIASSLIQKLNDKELGQLRSIFNNLSEKLTIVRDWGNNGVLNSHDIVSLNKKFFPLIDHQQQISGILLADNSGREYFLMQEDSSWLTRTTTPDSAGSTARYMSWQEPDHGRVIDEKKLDYDPTTRPWFRKTSDSEGVYWTPLYTFFETRGKGVTASVSWPSQENDSVFFVFGIDISLREIQQMMTLGGAEQVGMMFLVNQSTSAIIPGLGLNNMDISADSSAVLALLVRQWQENDRPNRETIQINHQGHSWHGSLQPLTVEGKTEFWIGVTAPEKELLARLNTTLLRVDFTDFLVATGGGLVLLFFIWKNGGFSRDRRSVEPLVQLHELINQGEGAKIEFKSTIRTNLKTGKKGKEIEFAWLKAVVAFLNTGGGTLLLGVEDNGHISGLAIDNFENSDRCLLHIKNLINQHIGAEFSGFLHVNVMISEDKDVIMIDVQRAGQPVFLKVGKNEEFYIRSGPSSVKLSPSQMISFVTQKRTRKKETGS